jgi:hypothetical protein
MGELQRIRAFLESVRRRVWFREALLWGAVGGAALLTVLLGLALSASRMGPGGFWMPITLGAGLACLVGAGAFGLWRPRRRLRSDPDAVRLLGRLNPTWNRLSGDILSAVELGEAAPAPEDQDPTLPGAAEPADEPAISPALARAFQGTVAEAVRPFSAQALIPLRPAAYGGLALLGTLALAVGLSLVSPGVIGRGLVLLFHRPTLFEGSTVSTVPIIGDVRLTYEYPPYTGLPVRVVEGSTGDIVGVRGTRVRIETTPLHKSRRAALLTGDLGDGPEIPLRLVKGVISAHLTLSESGNYRFWLLPLIGRAVREDRSHRIEVEADRPPHVEIQGPADRLELPAPRPIEVGYVASDDFGLGAVELVFRVDEAPEQRIALKDAHGAKTAQGRTLWDPARDGSLPLGARVAYHIEARDGDQISGPKVGVSRTLYVSIARPQESADDRLDRQREILEHLTGDLADRLELAPAQPGGAGAGAGAGARAFASTQDHGRGHGAPPAALALLAQRQAAYAAVHEAEEGHITGLGRLLDDDRREGILGKTLRNHLAGIAERLGRLLREERTALGKAVPRPGLELGPGRPPQRSLRQLAAGLGRLDHPQGAHVAELEKDILLLDDLIGRQRLEDLASIGRELTDSHKRLEDLLARYAATKDESLKRQLEREVRDLRARIADLAQKIANLKTRNEVPDEWRNLPDTKGAAEQARKLDELLSQGDPGAMSQALSELGKDLRGLREMLDENAEGFGEGRFPQENRVISDLMKRIGDLEGDERALAGETQGLSDKQEAEIDKRLQGQMADWVRKEGEKVERLRQSLGEVHTGDPESPLTEEVERARESAKQLKRLLGERDLAEAKGEAERATQSLDRAGEHATAAAARRKKRPGEGKAGELPESLASARALAQEIADDVERFLPRAEETLGPAERERARGQADRQSAIGDRADDTAREAARRLASIPGLERAEEDLRGASDQMRQAAEHLRKSEAKEAGGAERNAAERLAKLRDNLQERSMGGGKQQRDPVRIPGADESSAPRAWRQELLDAMKEHAPEHFRDDVRRYYEELVK